MRNGPGPDKNILVGVIAPLTEPGWTGAGRHLLAGVELGFRDVNDSGTLAAGIELLVEDTAADAEKAVAAVDQFARTGVSAVVGEYHSVVARAVATRADQIGLPFICASAVLDTLTDHPTDWVARLSPPQSRGWSEFADFLIADGHRKVVVANAKSIYWAAGTKILRTRLEAVDGDVLEIDVTNLTATELCDKLSADQPSVLLLLVGASEPISFIIRSIRQDPRLSELLIGAPAGQPELGEVHAKLGMEGTGIPFLRYLPNQLPEKGLRVVRQLHEQLGEPPSFVALEGYDAAKVTAELIKLRVRDVAMGNIWRNITVQGSRGLIRFSQVPSMSVWQWDDAPVQIADRDPADPNTFRVLKAAARQLDAGEL